MLQFRKQNSYRKTWSHGQWTLQQEEMLSIGHQIVFRFHLLVFRRFRIFKSVIRDIVRCDHQRGPQNHQLTKAGRAYDYQLVGFRGNEKGSSTYTRLAPEYGAKRMAWTSWNSWCVWRVWIQKDFVVKSGRCGVTMMTMILMILIMWNPGSFI